MQYCSFSYTQRTLQAFDVFHPCYPYEFLFCFVLYDLYGFEKCQTFKNGMMLKIGNQKTTRFVPGQNISGLKIKSWNKHVQINHNFGHISITWPLEMLNAHAIKWTYLEYWCKMLRANEWPLLDIGCFKTRRVWVKKVRKSTQKVNNATIWHMWQLYVLALCHMSHSLTVSKITIVTNDEFSF